MNQDPTALRGGPDRHDLSPAPPRLTGRRVDLQPVVEADYPFLFDLATCEELGYRWRNHGETPSPEMFHRSVWNNVLAQFIVRSIDTEESIGHVMVYRPDFQNGTAYIAQVVAPVAHGRGWALEGSALFLDYVFTMWSFRKLYGESLGYNYAQFASGASRSLFHEEGRLREHEFYGGRYWDLHFFAVYRTDWEAARAEREAQRRERADRWA